MKKLLDKVDDFGYFLSLKESPRIKLADVRRKQSHDAVAIIDQGQDTANLSLGSVQSFLESEKELAQYDLDITRSGRTLDDLVDINEPFHSDLVRDPTQYYHNKKRTIEKCIGVVKALQVGGKFNTSEKGHEALNEVADSVSALVRIRHEYYSSEAMQKARTLKENMRTKFWGAAQNK